MKSLLLVAIATLFAVSALANPVAVDWECGYTVLGLYGSGEPPIIATNVDNPVHGGERALELMDNSPDGTPQAYVAWCRGLLPGDVVEACIWRYDTTPGVSPSCRIWGHWNDDPEDIYGYAGSAGGNSDYGPGEGWDETCWMWENIDGHYGLVIEIRTYSNPGDTVWVDDLWVNAPPHVEIVVPECQNPVEDASWSAIKGMFR
jgi:hypothetical protein